MLGAGNGLASGLPASPAQVVNSGIHGLPSDRYQTGLGREYHRWIARRHESISHHSG
jgi:hypothetical protein